MRIKKVSQTTSTQAQVVDGYSASKTDSYSCNYVNELVEDISSEFTSSYTKSNLKALYYPKTKMVIITFSIQGIPSSNNWATIISTSNDKYKANADYYDSVYSTNAEFGAVGIANNSKDILGYKKTLFMGTFIYYTN